MFYLLLFYTCCAFSASSQIKTHTFYSDSSIWRMRRSMVSFVSSGPARELDAYLSYVSSVAFLSSFDQMNKSLKQKRDELLYKVYSDQFDLYNPTIEAGAPDHKSLFSEMKGIKGVHCVESVIELGLRQLVHQKLSHVEIKVYRLFHAMIRGLSDSLTPDNQRRFWVSWISEALTLEDKVSTFDLYVAVQRDLQGIYTKLELYNKLINRVLRQ